MVLRHLRHLHHQLQPQQLQAEPAAWEPIFSVAEQGADEFVDARDWCCGFMQAVDLAPAAWGSTWSNGRLAPLLLLGGGMEGVDLPTDGPDVSDPAACDALSRLVPELVVSLVMPTTPASAQSA
jgi:uncharacterized protein